MRTVCFPEHLELEYQGNIFSKAIIAADVDNDNCNELVAGNINGELFIYKGTDSKPWIKAADLGAISCIAVGDACNHGLNYVVCLSTEGYCHIFYIRADTARAPQPPPAAIPTTLDGYITSDNISSRTPESSVKPDPIKLLKWMHRQELRCNARVVLIADIDGDGQNEVVIGYTDRLVRAYKWTPDRTVSYQHISAPSSSSTSSSSEVASNNSSTASLTVIQDDTPASSVDNCNNIASSSSTGSTLVEVTTKKSSDVVANDDTLSTMLSNTSLESGPKAAVAAAAEVATVADSSSCGALGGENDNSSTSSVIDMSDSALPSADLHGAGDSSFWNGSLELFEEWQLAGQIGSMTVSKQADGRQIIVVSQPGGTFVNLLCVNSYAEEKQPDGTMKKIHVTTPSVVFHPLGSARARNPTVTTEVIDSISRRKKGEESTIPNYSAICTLDGTLTLVDDDKILWSISVDHQLFALHKLDVTGDGTEEVVVCSWDGQTYIVNLDKDVVRFQFREHVAAFYAGLYTLDKDNQNVPCLFYATFNDKIFVYYNLMIKSVRTTDLVETMSSNEHNLAELLKAFNCDATKREDVRQLYQYLLYGRDPFPSLPNS